MLTYIELLVQLRKCVSKIVVGLSMPIVCILG